MSIRMGSRSCAPTQTITDRSASHQVLPGLGTLTDAQYPSTRTPTKSSLCRSGIGNRNTTHGQLADPMRLTGTAQRLTVIVGEISGPPPGPAIRSGLKGRHLLSVGCRRFDPLALRQSIQAPKLIQPSLPGQGDVD